MTCANAVPGDKTIRSPSSLSDAENLATADDLRSFEKRLAEVLEEDQAWPDQSSRGRAMPDSRRLSKILARSRPTKAEIGYLHGLLTRAKSV